MLCERGLDDRVCKHVRAGTTGAKAATHTPKETAMRRSHSAQRCVPATKTSVLPKITKRGAVHSYDRTTFASDGVKAAIGQGRDPARSAVTSASAGRLQDAGADRGSRRQDHARSGRHPRARHQDRALPFVRNALSSIPCTTPSCLPRRASLRCVCAIVTLPHICHVEQHWHTLFCGNDSTFTSLRPRPALVLRYAVCGRAPYCA